MWLCGVHHGVHEHLAVGFATLPPKGANILSLHDTLFQCTNTVSSVNHNNSHID
jgi:hypothetical protein